MRFKAFVHTKDKNYMLTLDRMCRGARERMDAMQEMYYKDRSLIEKKKRFLEAKREYSSIQERAHKEFCIMSRKYDNIY